MHVICAIFIVFVDVVFGAEKRLVSSIRVLDFGKLAVQSIRKKL